MGVPQYTTPVFTLTFSDAGLDLTQATNVYVTFRSKEGETVTKSGEALTLTARSISVRLSQQDTGGLHMGHIKIQANWTDSEGHRTASEVVDYEITEQLLKQVVQ